VYHFADQCNDVKRLEHPIVEDSATGRLDNYVIRCVLSNRVNCVDKYRHL
jgi:hypothetical protein